MMLTLSGGKPYQLDFQTTCKAFIAHLSSEKALFGRIFKSQNY